MYVLDASKLPVDLTPDVGPVPWRIAEFTPSTTVQEGSAATTTVLVTGPASTAFELRIDDVAGDVVASDTTSANEHLYVALLPSDLAPASATSGSYDLLLVVGGVEEDRQAYDYQFEVQDPAIVDATFMRGETTLYLSATLDRNAPASGRFRELGASTWTVIATQVSDRYGDSESPHFFPASGLTPGTAYEFQVTSLSGVPYEYAGSLQASTLTPTAQMNWTIDSVPSVISEGMADAGSITLEGTGPSGAQANLHKNGADINTPQIIDVTVGGNGVWAYTPAPSVLKGGDGDTITLEVVPVDQTETPVSVSYTYETAGDAGLPKLIVDDINGAQHTFNFTTPASPDPDRRIDVYGRALASNTWIDFGPSVLHSAGSFVSTAGIIPTGVPQIEVSLRYFDPTSALLEADVRVFTQLDDAAGGEPGPPGMNQLIVPATNYAHDSMPRAVADTILTSAGLSHRFGGGEKSLQSLDFSGNRSLRVRQKPYPQYQVSDRPTMAARFGSGNTQVRCLQHLFVPEGMDYGPEPNNPQGSTQGQVAKCGLGLASEKAPSGGAVTSEGFSSRFIWRRESSWAQPKYNIYLYHFLQSQLHGDDYSTGVDVIEGRWVPMAMDAQLNSAYGAFDGRLRVWIDDILRINMTDVCFIGQQPSGGPAAPEANTIFLSAFYGGSTTQNWTPVTTQYFYLSDMYVGSGLF